MWVPGPSVSQIRKHGQEAGPSQGGDGAAEGPHATPGLGDQISCQAQSVAPLPSGRILLSGLWFLVCLSSALPGFLVRLPVW